MEIQEIFKTETTRTKHVTGRTFQSDVRLKTERLIKFIVLEGCVTFRKKEDDDEDDEDEDYDERSHHIEKGETFIIPDDWVEFEFMGDDLDMLWIDIFDHEIGEE
jgi:tellurite resistance-related uncharacterized protein